MNKKSSKPESMKLWLWTAPLVLLGILALLNLKEWNLRTTLVTDLYKISFNFRITSDCSHTEFTSFDSIFVILWKIQCNQFKVWTKPVDVFLKSAFYNFQGFFSFLEIFSTFSRFSGPPELFGVSWSAIKGTNFRGFRVFW